MALVDNSPTKVTKTTKTTIKLRAAKGKGSGKGRRDPNAAAPTDHGHQLWIGEHKQELFDLYNAGMSYRDIGKELGRTAQALRLIILKTRKSDDAYKITREKGGRKKGLPPQKVKREQASQEPEVPGSPEFTPRPSPVLPREGSKLARTSEKVMAAQLLLSFSKSAPVATPLTPARTNAAQWGAVQVAGWRSANPMSPVAAASDSLQANNDVFSEEAKNYLHH